jgi:two-component system, sensor histidine kinase and response regulator
MLDRKVRRKPVAVPDLVRLNPDATNPSRPPGLPAATDAGASAVQCVLLVDDDPAVREMFSQALRLAGFDVMEAATGTEALERLRSTTQIGVILLDLKMPDMDGWRFRLAQRTDPRMAAIPTVITTGAPLSEVLDCDLKAADYLLKPVGIEHLISVVSHYVEPAREANLVW